MSDILIIGTAYVDTREKMEVLRMWSDLADRLNPGVDRMIIDSVSPIDIHSRVRGNDLFHLRDNIGHLSKTGRDGWGRAFTAGLDHAIGRYEWVVHIETDLLFNRSVREIIDKMTRSGVRVASAMAYPWPFPETGLCFMHVPTMVEYDFINRYDWERPPARPLPEQRFAAIMDDVLFALPLRGCRDDARSLTPWNLDKAYPCGMDWVTHSSLDVMREFHRRAIHAAASGT